MMAKQFTLADLKQRLQEHRLKLPPQRQIILRVFLEHKNQHLSAEDVHGILRDGQLEIGLATVYRSLELLAQLGILQRLEFGDGCSRYELNTTDPEQHQHHHLICMRCGKVQEFDDDMLESLEKDIAEKSGFQIVDHQVKFFGICKECQAQGES